MCRGGGGGCRHDTWLWCCLQMAAPVGLSPTLIPFPPQAVLIGLSQPFALRWGLLRAMDLMHRLPQHFQPQQHKNRSVQQRVKRVLQPVYVVHPAWPLGAGRRSQRLGNLHQEENFSGLSIPPPPPPLCPPPPYVPHSFHACIHLQQQCPCLCFSSGHRMEITGWTVFTGVMPGTSRESEDGSPDTEKSEVVVMGSTAQKPPVLPTPSPPPGRGIALSWKRGEGRRGSLKATGEVRVIVGASPCTLHHPVP